MPMCYVPRYRSRLKRASDVTLKLVQVKRQNSHNFKSSPCRNTIQHIIKFRRNRQRTLKCLSRSTAFAWPINWEPKYLEFTWSPIQCLTCKSNCFDFVVLLRLSSNITTKASESLTSFVISLVMKGARPNLAIYEVLLLPQENVEATLESGNMSRKRSPIDSLAEYELWSVIVFKTHNTSAWRVFVPPTNERRSWCVVGWCSVSRSVVEPVVALELDVLAWGTQNWAMAVCWLLDDSILCFPLFMWDSKAPIPIVPSVNVFLHSVQHTSRSFGTDFTQKYFGSCSHLGLNRHFPILHLTSSKNGAAAL